MPGLELVESTTLRREELDYLFAVLIATSIACFVAGNILAFQADAVVRTVPIFGVCLGLICVLYGLARILGGLLVGSTCMFAAIFVFVALRQPWITWICFAAVAVAGIYTATQLKFRRDELFQILLLGALGAAVVFSSNKLESGLDISSALEAGCPSKDTLYHAAIAAMIKNYGVVSTGLNGLVETPYYAMTHYLVAAVSRLSSRGVIDVFCVVNLTLLIPLLLFAVTYVACAVARSASSRVLSRVWIFSSLTLVVLPWSFSSWHLSSLCFGSESYAFSLVLLLFAFPCYFLRRLRWFDVAVLLGFTAILSYTKISTALFIPGLAFLRFAALTTEKKGRDALLFFGSGVIVAYFLFVVVRASEFGGQPGFGLSRVLETIPLGSAWVDVASAWCGGGTWAVTSILLAGVALLLYAFFHFIVSWCVLWVGVRQVGVGALLRSPVGVFVAGSAMAGLVLSCVFRDYNNIATYYFSNPPLFLALPFLGSLMAGHLAKSMRGERLAIFTGIVVCVLSIKSYYKNSVWAAYLVRSDLSSQIASELIHLRQTAPLTVVFRAPAQVCSLPLTRIRSTQFVLTPTTQPFLFPAVSERPWTGVTGPRGTNIGENYISYGYPRYDMDSETGRMLSPPVLPEGMSIREWAFPR